MASVVLLQVKRVTHEKFVNVGIGRRTSFGRGKGVLFRYQTLTDFILRTHPISGGLVCFLSKATNDVNLASWRRIKFVDTGNISDSRRCEVSPGADCHGKSDGVTLLYAQLSVFASCPPSHKLTQ